MREIKFRAYNKDWKMLVQPEDIEAIFFDGVTAAACDVKFNITTTDGRRNTNIWEDTEDIILMQYTGLKDKNGKEIYELMEIDGKYRVLYDAPSYVLQDISKGDIIPIYDEFEITGDYSPLS